VGQHHLGNSNQRSLLPFAGIATVEPVEDGDDFDMQVRREYAHAHARLLAEIISETFPRAPATHATAPGAQDHSMPRATPIFWLDQSASRRMRLVEPEPAFPRDKPRYGEIRRQREVEVRNALKTVVASGKSCAANERGASNSN
jgi:hypothetical protein